jgi:hypothetical protein
MAHRHKAGEDGLFTKFSKFITGNSQHINNHVHDIVQDTVDNSYNEAMHPFGGGVAKTMQVRSR